VHDRSIGSEASASVLKRDLVYQADSGPTAPKSDRLLDDGGLTDGLGRTADFCNAVIVMAPNLGLDVIQ